MSTSTPRTHRPSHPRSQRREPSSTTPARPNTPPLPPYEPPSAPLNAGAQNALANLLGGPSLRQLRSHVQRVEERLADSAGEVNERLTDARVRYQKERMRKRRAEVKGEGGEEGEERDGDEEREGDGDGEELERLARLEERVKSVTEELEGRMRRVIDAEVRMEGLGGILTALGKEAEEAGGSAGRQGRGRGRGEMRRSRRLRHGVDADGNEEEEDDDDEEEYEATPEHEDRAPTIPPSRKLAEQMAEESARWESQSLTHRYSTNNTYIGFYRIVHEAKHPGDDIPPLPHASTWFSHLEDPTTTTTTTSTPPSPTTRRTRQHPSPSSPTPTDSDTDSIAIERERISLKCPLTLLPFRDPVTSTKCPHSFERAAITDMITQSPTTIAPPPSSTSTSSTSTATSTTTRRRVRAVKCPVCSVLLAATDLRADPVLLRRVRRAEAASQREAEEEEFAVAEGGQRGVRRGRGGRKSGITVGSEDDDDEGDGEGMDVDGDGDVDMEGGGRDSTGTGRRSEEMGMASQAVRVKQEAALSQISD